MPRRLIGGQLILVLLGALALLAGPADSALASTFTATSTSSESGSPIEDQGSNYDYRSYITSVTPKVAGLSWKCWSSPTAFCCATTPVRR